MNSGVAWAVVPAGGRGERFSAGQDKLLVPLDGIPVLARSVMALLAAESVSGVMIACRPEKQAVYEAVIRDCQPAKPVRFAGGGRDRRESVYNGVLALPVETEIVAVHDAARPLIAPGLVEAAVRRVREGVPGCIVGVPIRDTVKTVAEDRISGTVDRSLLWRAQTPQVFLKSVLLAAVQAVPEDTPVTDDAQLLELAGLGPVHLLEGDERNLKITTPQDVAMAEAWLAMATSPPGDVKNHC